jgi:hypothetical protein
MLDLKKGFKRVNHLVYPLCNPQLKIANIRGSLKFKMGNQDLHPLDDTNKCEGRSAQKRGKAGKIWVPGSMFYFFTYKMCQSSINLFT